MTTPSETSRDLALEIAEKLGETEENPIEQIRMIIDIAGAEFAQRKLREALKIQKDGGLQVHRGSRKRTTGGIFFYAVKAELDPGAIKTIFPDFGKEIKRILQWEERIKELDNLVKNAEKTGTLRKNPSIIIEGRPGEVLQIENTIVMLFDHPHKEAPYPKGVVPIPQETQMRYILYIGYRQWQKVDITIKNPEDYLIAEGFPLWDAELGAVAVFVQKLTSKHLQQNKRSQVANENVKIKRPAKTIKPAKTAKPAKEAKGRKESKPQKPASKSKPAKDSSQKNSPKGKNQDNPPQEGILIPEGITPNDAAKLRKLHSAAETFRERIAMMEAKGQAGIDMTRRLLTNTEKQIESIIKQYR